MTKPLWRKSSRSNTQTSCVELPSTLDAIRDSKNGAVLPVTRRAVVGLLTAAKRS
jgi:hypothetical protein